MERNDNPKRLFAILLSILIFSSIAGCINQDKNGNDNTPNRDSLVIGVSELNFGFYPWSKSYDTATMDVNMNIFNTLVEPDQIFRLKPKLATSWNNPNNITWRFYLLLNLSKGT
jgi:ABC-type oligopeptide transport system substrate-binding subunit